MKRLIITVLMLLALCGCEGRDPWPRVVYEPSYWEFSTVIPMQDGYDLDQGHMYDTIDTEQGYDLVLHFVKEDTDG